MSGVLQHPHEQYRKCGSIMLVYKFFKIFCGRNCFACFSAHMVLGTFLDDISTCFFQVRSLSI